MAVVEFLGKPETLDLTEGLEESPDILGRGLECHIPDYNLGALTAGVLPALHRNRRDGHCGLLQAQLQGELMSIQHSSLHHISLKDQHSNPVFEGYKHMMQHVAFIFLGEQ